MKKKITILGSTGSIGKQSLNILRNRPDEYEIIGLSAGNNLELLVEQIKEFKPKYASILGEEKQKELKPLFPDLKIAKDIKELASIEATDIVISAIVGIAGLEANLLALEHSKRVAIANKETLVVAGHLVEAAVEEFGSELIPIDSEHVAIHQCLSKIDTKRVNLCASNEEVKSQQQTNSPSPIKEILLTSSGGPFRLLPAEEFQNIKLEDALKHPTWNMGPKITIDSSTMMNKALEIIEIKSLFGKDYGIDYDQVKVVIHPESVIHSAVSFIDGNTIAQMGSPNMEIPIQYALDYPERRELANTDKTSEKETMFDIFNYPKLEFEKPDLEKFPAIRLAYEVGKESGSLNTVFNSANEAAVNLFLEGKINYLDIMKAVEAELKIHKTIANPSLETILEIHNDLIKKISREYSNTKSLVYK